LEGNLLFHKKTISNSFVVIGLAIYGLVAPVVAKKREMSKHDINGNPNFYRPLSHSNSRVQPNEHDERSTKTVPRRN